jgi:hypothetical protein
VGVRSQRVAQGSPLLLAWPSGKRGREPRKQAGRCGRARPAEEVRVDARRPFEVIGQRDDLEASDESGAVEMMQIGRRDGHRADVGEFEDPPRRFDRRLDKGGKRRLERELKDAGRIERSPPRAGAQPCRGPQSDGLRRSAASPIRSIQAWRDRRVWQRTLQTARRCSRIVFLPSHAGDTPHGRARSGPRYDVIGLPSIFSTVTHRPQRRSSRRLSRPRRTGMASGSTTRQALHSPRDLETGRRDAPTMVRTAPSAPHSRHKPIINNVLDRNKASIRQR